MVVFLQDRNTKNDVLESGDSILCLLPVFIETDKNVYFSLEHLNLDLLLFRILKQELVL